MPSILKITLFFFCCLVPAIIANSLAQPYSPQIIAFFSLILVAYSYKYKKVPTTLVVLIVQMIVFTTGGLLSPLLFLEYFLLFSLSFQENPQTILVFSIILAVLISQSLISARSLIYLLSLVFISPLAYLVTQKFEESQNRKMEILLWLSLELKQKLLARGDIKLAQHTDDLINELKDND
ncbi:MAG: hypothetical protein AAB574_03520 [Patescibacteria group bacterium]